MTNPSIEQMNRRVAEALGIEWHEMKTVTDLSQDGWMWTTCSCGDKFSDNSIAKRHRNPDFSADPLALLRVMKEKGLFLKFMYDLYMKRQWSDGNDGAVSFAEMAMTPGELVNAVDEWIGREK